jgi:23S rRNA pseudouridine955/2504/2580 synthase
MQTITINQNDQGQRIDSFLKKTYPKISLNLIYRYLRSKRIKVNNKKVDYDYRLKIHDQLQLYINDLLLTKKISQTDFLLAPNNLNVVYEDTNVLLVNKPVGLVVHDDESKGIDTLVNRVKHYLYKKHE